MDKCVFKKVHESSSIAGTVWDKRYLKTTKIPLQKDSSPFPISKFQKRKKKKKTKGKEKEALAVNGFILRALMKAEL